MFPFTVTNNTLNLLHIVVEVAAYLDLRIVVQTFLTVNVVFYNTYPITSSDSRSKSRPSPSPTAM